MVKILLNAAILVFASVTFAANTQTCGQLEQPVSYSYCITKTVGSTNQDVLYFLHGGGGSADQWAGISAGIYSQWNISGTPPPIVVSISFGKYWLLVEPNGSENSGLLPVFHQAVIPQMEILALGAPAQRRLLMGLSMGGFNGIQALAKLPPDTFARASFVCPALVDLSPFSSQNEILDYAVAHGANVATLHSISQIAREFVPDETTWQTQVSPYQLIPQIAGVNVPILMGINQLDNNFKYGADVFAQALLPLKQDAQIQSWPGGHCQLKDSAIATFLSGQ